MSTTKKIVSVYLLVTILLVSFICVKVYCDFKGLVDENFSNLLNTNSKFALEFIDSKYYGNWNIKGDKLYKGDTLINENAAIVDEIKEIINGEVTIFLKDTRIATTIIDEDGKRQIGTKASAQVIEEVIEKGNEYNGNADVLGVEYDTKYTPLKDGNGQVVGMFFIGVPQDYILKIINSSIFSIIMWSMILVIIGTVLYNVLTKINIIKPLEMMKEYLKSIASGDFTIEVDSKFLNRKDEFGEIAKASKDMCNSLRGMILNISEKSKEVGASSQELAATSEEMSASSQELASTMQHVADGAAKQAQDIVEIVNSLSELSNNIENVYKVLQNVKDESESVENKAHVGNKELDTLVESIQKIKNAFKLAASKLEALTNSVKEISGITEIISGISEQTNLLALNAAIEAARAGEYGRGFAVVAEEVRKLAEETKKSTERITNLVSSITEDNDEVIHAFKTVEQSTKEQDESVENAVKSFEDILVSIENIAPLINKTYSAMDEIAKSKDIVMKRVEHVNEVTQENSGATEEVAASSEELTASSEEVASTAQSLNVIAMNLLEMTNHFKV